jgi:hypothetical protein
MAEPIDELIDLGTEARAKAMSNVPRCVGALSWVSRLVPGTLVG